LELTIRPRNYFHHHGSSPFAVSDQSSVVGAAKTETNSGTGSNKT